MMRTIPAVLLSLLLIPTAVSFAQPPPVKIGKDAVAGDVAGYLTFTEECGGNPDCRKTQTVPVVTKATVRP